jgi:hypothetical protein
MLKETFLARLKQMREQYPLAEFIVVTATARHVLAPPWHLVKTKSWMPWASYERYYLEHIERNPKAIAELARIKQLSETKDVFLVCYEKEYPCHRFIIMELIKNMED